MNKLTAISAMAVALTFSGNALQAADFEAERAIQELVVSGVVEKWSGYTFTDHSQADVDKSDFFSSGGSGRLSLPLGSNLSMQMDGSLEYTEGAFDSDDSDDVFQSAYQFGGHLTYRDPESFAFGVFGGFGGGNTENEPYDGYALGGEAQIYLNDFTIYAQGGFLDSIDRSGNAGNSMNDAFFARGVGRWYITPDDRLQVEFAYASGKQDDDNDDMDLLSWGARYDTMIGGLPIVGDTRVFLAYRGTYADIDEENTDYTDHTIMIGSRLSFGGSSLKETERYGVGFDLPDFNRWVGIGPIVD